MMVFKTKPTTESKKPAFSLQIHLSEETTRWVIGSLLAITFGSAGVAWAIQSPSNPDSSRPLPHIQSPQHTQNLNTSQPK